MAQGLCGSRALWLKGLWLKGLWLKGLWLKGFVAPGLCGSRACGSRALWLKGRWLKVRWLKGLWLKLTECSWLKMVPLGQRKLYLASSAAQMWKTWHSASSSA